MDVMDFFMDACRSHGTNVDCFWVNKAITPMFFGAQGRLVTVLLNIPSNIQTVGSCGLLLL